MGTPEEEDLLKLVLRLKQILESHLDRDVTVSEIVSGEEPVWLCQREVAMLRTEIATMSRSAAADQDELSDLRESVREGMIAQEAAFDAHRENARLEHEILVLMGTVEVPPEQQLELFKEWLSG